ncbi:MAG TPA: alcohol dehydrogenase catalytic domain-containing protein [Gemmatimonadales bacterium]|nr:alcohol dehydrogenase catalytic domain-containing protein [Gemmatimonadales bacterium]
MQVARIHGAGDLRLHDEPVPTPGPGEALVRVTAVGVCGSDVHWWQEGRIGDDRIEVPLVLGHECAGVIESGERRGQRVAIDPAQTCGRCEFCEQGQVNLCAALRFAGHAPQDGALRSYVAWPERCLVALPASLSDADGAMLEPLGVALYSVDLGEVKPGTTVGVFGCGTIGLSVIQLARAAGAARVFATDLPAVAHRLEAARRFGATAFAAEGGREVEGILRATGGRGVDVAFDAAGDPEAVEAAVAAAKPGGRAILIGIPCEDRTTFTASTARRKDLAIRVVHRMKHTYPRTIALVESGRVDVRSQVTHHFPLAEVGRAFAVAQRREGIKVVIDC